MEKKRKLEPLPPRTRTIRRKKKMGCPAVGWILKGREEGHGQGPVVVALECET